MRIRMLTAMVSIALGMAVLPAPAAFAQTFSPAAVTMFHALRQQPNDLARYVYLAKAIPKLPIADQPIAMQMFAAAENELGLYNEALRDFPLKSHLPAGTSLPTTADWSAADAAEVITSLAADRRLVLINEAHHDAHTRELTLALLPRLRALGFNYFAAEALLDHDPQLMQRGYPITLSGTEYLHEPEYGEIVRLAIKLGFTLVPYDVDDSSMQGRESGQANTLYRKVFAKDPDARLFVHAGYAHIDKAKGRLGNVQPMAMQLQQLSGIEPLSIDQTQFREQIPNESDDAYPQLVKRFAPSGPTVLLNRVSGKPWSAHPDQYDANVILPPVGQSGVESGYVQPQDIVSNTARSFTMLPEVVYRKRPPWLAQGGQRAPYPISTWVCKFTLPCVVDAHYPDEPDDAIAADRYIFMQENATSTLYLRPGRYRLRAWNLRGQTLYERVITVTAP